MHILLILTLLLFIPLVPFIGKRPLPTLPTSTNNPPAYLALSSCLGDSFRARISGFPINPRRAVYDQNYLRTMTNQGAMSEQIELQDMLHESRGDEYGE